MVYENNNARSALSKERKTRVGKLIRTLKKLFPDTGKTMLNYNTNYELLFAVILSAQCTDKKVNEVTTRLFKKYPTLDDYCHASFADFSRDIRETGFYKSKARHILASAKKLRDEYGEVLPQSMEELITFPGVGRKTANVVLGNAYGIIEGIAVDTHVHRFAKRFDLTDAHTPEGIERDLMQIIPKGEWFFFTYRVISYGREIAPARKYDTSKDPLIGIYPPAGERFRLSHCQTSDV